MSDIPKDQNELTEEEAAKRRDEALKRALGTPPKPHKKPAPPSINKEALIRAEQKLPRKWRKD